MPLKHGARSSLPLVSSFSKRGMVSATIPAIAKTPGVIWSVNSPDYYLLLIDQRSWSLDQFESFLTNA